MSVTIPDIGQESAKAFINSDSFKYLSTKRIIDLTAIVLVLPLVIGIAVITAIAIKLESPGAVFFWQKRVGMNGKVFNMLWNLVNTKLADKFANTSDTHVIALGKLRAMFTVCECLFRPSSRPTLQRLRT